MSASAGKVLLTPKGDYDASTTYSILDWVRYNGGVYVAKQTTTGNLPTDTDYWSLMLNAPANLADLTDVAIDTTTLADGQTLVYNATTGKFENATGGGGVGKNLEGQTVEPEQGTTVTALRGAEIFNDYRPRAYTGTTPMEGNVASGYYSYAEGQATTASGNFSHAEGTRTIASGSVSHAEGASSKAIGTNSHAEGNYSNATGINSHAEGNSTAGGSYSHAEGYSRATGSNAHAEGRDTLAGGNYSHAEGYQTKANGDYAHVGGNNVTTNREYSFAYGNWSNTKSMGGINATGFTFAIDCSTPEITLLKTIDAKTGASGVITSGSYNVTLTLDKAAIYLLVVSEIVTADATIGGSGAYLVAASASDTQPASLVELGKNGTIPTVATVSGANKITVKKSGTTVKAQFNLIRVA